MSNDFLDSAQEAPGLSHRSFLCAARPAAARILNRDLQDDVAPVNADVEVQVIMLPEADRASRRQRRIGHCWH